MNMELSELVEHVAAGGQEQMDELVKRVQPRLRAYILRCTLNEDLAEDILQETMLQLLVSLKSLKNPQRFWPWLYKIASNMIISHFRKEKYRASIKFSSMEDYLLESALQDPSNKDEKGPVTQEMFSMILNSMKVLTTTQRSIMSLRCFEDMQYQEIAEAVGCTESTARVQFLRARKKLKSALAKRGLTRKAVLPSLVLFGKLTAGQKALAATITPATVTLDAGLTAIQTITTTIRIWSNVAAMLTVAGAVVLSAYIGWNRFHPSPFPLRPDVYSAHYTVQGIGLIDEDKVASQPTERSRKADVDAGPYYSKGAYEEWLRFPEGPDGPVQVRMQRWGMDAKSHENTSKLCGWLQNGRANYYYSSGDNKIYITNDPIGMLIMPTDSPEMVKFLTQNANYQDNIKYSYDRRTKLSKARIDNRVPAVIDYKTEYAYNTLTEKDFEPFWPENASVIDQRDLMHHRGWTTFILEGHLGSLPISGSGQIPFCYEASQEHSAWLDVRIGDTLHILDTPDGACMIDETSSNVQYYPSGTFFAGMGRPWTGIRAYDTIRRDAAKDGILFTAKREGEKATVKLEQRLGYTAYKINYFIDMSKDTITGITFSRIGDDPIDGKLTLTYAQELTDLPGAFEQPQLPTANNRKLAKSESHNWLLTLLEDTTNSINTKAILLTQKR